MSKEPEYIKIYTQKWKEKPIQKPYLNLFMNLVNYAEQTEDGLTVSVVGPIKEKICENLNCGKANVNKGLKALREAEAIEKISRGLYRINPEYARKKPSK